MQLQILDHQNIDKSKWDLLVQAQAKQPIYNSVAYLDHWAPGWKALIVGDYEVVMALPIKKKMGIVFLTTPPFLQQLAIIGQVSEALLQTIYGQLTAYFKLMDINVNYVFPGSTPKMRTNFVLHLSVPYDAIAAGYTTLCKRNLKKAQKHNFLFQIGVDIGTVLNTFATYYKDKIAYTSEHIKQLEQFAIRYPNKVQTFSVVHEGRVIYQCLCLIDAKRIYYLISAPSEEGVKYKATYWCMDQIIRHYASQHLVLDFEGSDIEDIAFYYSRFGPQVEPYYNYRQNKLPFGWRQIVTYKLGF